MVMKFMTVNKAYDKILNPRVDEDENTKKGSRIKSFGMLGKYFTMIICNQRSRSQKAEKYYSTNLIYLKILFYKPKSQIGPKINLF